MRKLCMAHANERLVITRFHIDLRLRLQTIVDDEGQPITLANGWNCTMHAIGE
jgi:hypothetical protein